MHLLRTPALAHLWAAVRQRCPRCCRGSIFHERFAMYEHCPVCGLKYEREPGYFLGAMYVSYFLSIPLIGLALGILTLLFPSLGWEWRVGLSGVVLVPFAPWLFRISRSLWIYFDRSVNPLH